MLTDNSFQNLSDPIPAIAESFIGRLFERIKQVARRVINDPEATINIQQIIRDVRGEHSVYLDNTTKWVDESLPIAYMRGLKEVEGTIRELDIEAEPTTPILKGTQLAVSGGGGGAITPTAADILQNYPRHHTMYSVFQEAAYEGFAQTQFPVVRDVQGKVREIIIQASEEAYQESNIFTRRQMTQDLMNRFADDNINGITYSDGRRVNLDAYSEMVARSQTGNAARQASMNRQQQYGYDLVRISTHFPCSDLCIDEQGRVFSISGTSNQYPSLDSAISGGLYHANSFEKETEVFTKEGWKFFRNVKKEDIILSLNPDTYQEEWAEIDLLHSYNFKGNLIHFYDERYMDLRVTPDHMVFVWLVDPDQTYQLIEAQQVQDVEHTHITERGPALHTKPKVKEIEYDDMVYCVTLEKNHIMWVRRNGKTTWSGNCKHFQNPYFPGISPKQEIRQDKLSKKENRRRYELTQQQRYHERMIRKWKRRESAALTDEAREKAKRKVSDWQARQRNLIDNNPHLRRKYSREQV